MRKSTFRKTYDEIIDEPLTEVHLAQDPSVVEPGKRIHMSRFRACWDTGASATVVSPAVVKKCGLQPIKSAYAYTASSGNEKIECDVCKIVLCLPNAMCFCEVDAVLLNVAKTDVLIGMDIIARGKFKVWPVSGQTKLCFRCWAKPFREFRDLDIRFDKKTAEALPRVFRL